jgi:hypothetical protein
MSETDQAKQPIQNRKWHGFISLIPLIVAVGSLAIALSGWRTNSKLIKSRDEAFKNNDQLIEVNQQLIDKCEESLKMHKEGVRTICDLEYSNLLAIAHNVHFSLGKKAPRDLDSNPIGLNVIQNAAKLAATNSDDGFCWQFSNVIRIVQEKYRIISDEPEADMGSDTMGRVKGILDIKIDSLRSSSYDISPQNFGNPSGFSFNDSNSINTYVTQNICVSRSRMM